MDPGWEALSSYANDPTSQQLPDHPNVVCAPAEPNLDPKAFDELVKSTRTSTRPSGATRPRMAWKSAAPPSPMRRS